MIRVALIAMLLAAPAAAAPSDEAFASGRFAEAASAGRAEGSVAGLITAGRATSTVAAWQTRDKARARALLEQAGADFAAALRLQPGNSDALLQQGIVVGYLAKLDRSPGQAKAARRAFEAVLAKRPTDALALGAMGGWHGESVATLGKFMAGTVLGAKEKEAIRFYDKAVATGAGDPAVPVFYAQTLLALSADNAGKARALLTRAVKAGSGDGFDRLMQAHARAILVPLEKGDVGGARTTAARLSPLGNLN